MSSPTWSVYESEWGVDPDDAGPSLPPERTLRGCGLRRVDVIQRGSQGVVYRAVDSTGAFFAVKRLFTQRSDFGVRGLSEGALREATLLAHIASRGDVPGVVRLHRIVEAPHQEMCLVLEHCPLDLSRLVLRKKRRLHSTRPLAEAASVRCPVLTAPFVVPMLLRDILRVLRFLHDDCHIVHRDVKLSNLLVQADGTLRLSDFGSARLTRDAALSPPTSDKAHKNEKEEKWNEEDGEFTPAALRTTIVYQAPESLLGHRGRATALDIWAAGVVFAELLLQEHLFNARSELGVLSAVWKMLGTPTDDDAAAAAAAGAGCAVTPAVESEPTIGRKFAGNIVSAEGLELLRRMLQMDPAQRISAAEALRHPFLQLSADDEEGARQLWKGKVREFLEEASRPVKVGMQELYVDFGNGFEDEDEEDDDIYPFEEASYQMHSVT